MIKTIQFLLAACAMLVLTGCNEPKQISSQEFMNLHARNPESMRYTEFMGIENGKAILKVSEMSIVNKKKWNDSYFITDATNLPPEWIMKNQPNTQK